VLGGARRRGGKVYPKKLEGELGDELRFEKRQQGGISYQRRAQAPRNPKSGKGKNCAKERKIKAINGTKPVNRDGASRIRGRKEDLRLPRA